MQNTKFDINTIGRDFFVGDLHGMYDEFMHALRTVDFDFDKDRVFVVGDLIDRGPKSFECLLLLSKPWFHSVKGNHEDMLIGGQPHHVWMMNGGQWFNALTEDEQACAKQLVQFLMHDTITVDTPDGTIGVVHADAFGDWGDLEKDDWTGEAATLWGRSRYQSNIQTKVTGIDMVVVGHTPTDQPLLLGNVLYIDQGAVFDMNDLTILEAKEVLACA